MLFILKNALGVLFLFLLCVLVGLGVEWAVKRAHAWIVRMTGGAA